ncbi:bifunctional riboflavin kinase/FAD synthetase [bacterium]|nr:bifunctional riboflavin kinase/FAD synthetase [bacterium]
MSLLQDFAAPAGSTSVALGFFDGFHRGHQAILAATCQKLRPLTFTFRNHPACVISSERTPGLLTTSAERQTLLVGAGSEVVWCDFDRPFSQLSPEEFFQNILLDKLGAGRLVSGSNYRFGHRASGDVALLRSLAQPLGIEVVTVPGVEEGGQWISSTRIRQCIGQGDLEQANRMLGRNFALSARVVRGDQRGRQLGFPTANLQLPVGKVVPAFGVYACWVERAGQRHAAVANLGVRPTVISNGEAVLEVHLLDFDGDLYGEHLYVELTHFLRPEQRFADLDELKAQIERDRDRARERLLRPA